MCLGAEVYLTQNSCCHCIHKFNTLVSVEAEDRLACQRLGPAFGKQWHEKPPTRGVMQRGDYEG
jgi:hypothetical protein